MGAKAVTWLSEVGHPLPFSWCGVEVVGEEKWSKNWQTLLLHGTFSRNFKHALSDGFAFCFLLCLHLILFVAWVNSWFIWYLLSFQQLFASDKISWSPIISSSHSFLNICYINSFFFSLCTRIIQGKNFNKLINFRFVSCLFEALLLSSLYVIFWKCFLVTNKYL